MFVYLDESGDTGFKFNKGSSRYFVITLLLVVDPIPFHEAVDELRESLGVDRQNEFKSVYLDYIRVKISDLWEWRPRVQ